jgi:hypothetical protein
MERWVAFGRVAMSSRRLAMSSGRLVETSQIVSTEIELSQIVSTEIELRVEIGEA